MSAALDDAIALHRAGRLDEAAAAYAAVLAAEPDNVQALTVSAILSHQGGDQAVAVARLRRAIALDPGFAPAHNNLANIHREAGETEAALAAYRAALTAQPGHLDTMCNMATLLADIGRVGEATGVFEQILANDPGHVEANHNLALAYAQAGRFDAAAERIEACYAHGRPPVVDPAAHARILVRLGRRARAVELMEMHAASRPGDPIVAHELAALRGEAPPRASDAYVREHFDGFADSFDARLASLGYGAPSECARLAAALCDGRKVNFLADLGCGTGLMGPVVRPLAASLVGVDLSPRMLEHAGRRGVYDHLIEAELVCFLGMVPPGAVGLGVAADTLCYFGALDGVFAALARALEKGGGFVGTVELHEGPEGHRFLHTGRYSHSEAYLGEVAAAHGFALRFAERVRLREELGEPIPGLLFAMQNAAP